MTGNTKLQSHTIHLHDGAELPAALVHLLDGILQLVRNVQPLGLELGLVWTT